MFEIHGLYYIDNSKISTLPRFEINSNVILSLTLVFSRKV